MSLVLGGGTDSGVDTGNESNDIDVGVGSENINGFDENDGAHAVPPPPPTSPESAASEGHGREHDDLELDMAVARDNAAEAEFFPGLCEEMDRDFEEDELKGVDGGDEQMNVQDKDNDSMFTSNGGGFSLPPIPQPSLSQEDASTNTCKALIKFELPQLPKLKCIYSEPPAGLDSFMSLEAFSIDQQTKGYFVIPPSDGAFRPSLGSTSACTALIPYNDDKPREGGGIRRRRFRRRDPILCQSNERRLRTAASAKNIPVLAKILNTDVDPNAADEMGRTALHIAACKGYSEVVRMLLNAGANPNKKDSVGNTPLHLAACTNHFDVVTCLLRAGTDVSTLDNNGRNPLQLAQSKLKLIASSKQPISEDALKVKMEVQQIIEMMLEYLQKKGQDVEAELLNAFANRLTLSQTPAEVDADVKSLLANLSTLTLAPSPVQRSSGSPFRAVFNNPVEKDLAIPGPSRLHSSRHWNASSAPYHLSSPSSVPMGPPENSKIYQTHDLSFQRGDESSGSNRMADFKLFK